MNAGYEKFKGVITGMLSRRTIFQITCTINLVAELGAKQVNGSGKILCIKKYIG